MSFKASEILLLLFLLAIVGFTRVYYGGPQGPMFVWKGEFSYKDTLVSLPDFMKIPHEQALIQHPKLVDQLEEMGMIDSPDFIYKPRHRRNVPVPETIH